MAEKYQGIWEKKRGRYYGREVDVFVATSCSEGIPLVMHDSLEAHPEMKPGSPSGKCPFNF